MDTLSLRKMQHVFCVKLFALRKRTPIAVLCSTTICFARDEKRNSGSTLLPYAVTSWGPLFWCFSFTSHVAVDSPSIPSDGLANFAGLTCDSQTLRVGHDGDMWHCRARLQAFVDGPETLPWSRNTFLTMQSKQRDRLPRDQSVALHGSQFAHRSAADKKIPVSFDKFHDHVWKVQRSPHVGSDTDALWVKPGQTSSGFRQGKLFELEGSVSLRFHASVSLPTRTSVLLADAAPLWRTPPVYLSRTRDNWSPVLYSLGTNGGTAVHRSPS